MVKLAFERATDKDNIRNITVIGSEKSLVTDSLVKAAGILSQDTLENEETSTTIKSVGFSLCYEINKESLECCNGCNGDRFLLNLTVTPGHSEISPEIMAAFCISDGALVVVDCAEGVSLETQQLLRGAVLQRIKPVLTVNMMDACLFGLKIDGEKAYQTLSRVIKDTNTILSSCEDKLLGDVRFHPEEGTVAFSGLPYAWAFTLSRFAKIYAPEFGMTEQQMRERLWGDNFFDTDTNQWTSHNTGSKTCKRGFVVFCYEPIREIMVCCMNDQKDKLWPLVEQFNITIKDDQKKLRKKSLLKCVMDAWLPAGKALIELIICHLPSPAKAQKYRVENLYKGPLNDVYADAIRNCDSEGPLMMYISKMIPAPDRRTLFAFGRVFSGRVAIGEKVRFVGPGYVPGHCHMDVKRIARMAEEIEHVEDVPCGNTLFLVSLNKPVKYGTLTLTAFKALDACPIRPIKISVSPIVKLAAQEDTVLKAIGKRSGEVFRLPYRVYDGLYLHQREAINWLWSKHCQDIGAILADDMGLGKTREVAAFLAGLLHSDIIRRAIIIVPQTLVHQWGRELEDVNIQSEKFVKPGNEPAVNRVIGQGGILITTYDAFRLHLAEFVEDWDYVFLDEGHRIKSSDTLVWDSLEAVICNHRIVITGTPEFYNLMDFCHPTLLGRPEDFEEKFINPIDRGKHRDAEPLLKERCAAAINELRRLTSPFVLRRTKKLLKAEGRLKSDKHELIAWIKLSPRQIGLYTELLQDGALKMQGTALSALRLAQDICNHPQLLLSESPEEASVHYKQMKDRLISIYDANVLFRHQNSSKLSLLLLLVPYLLREQHKILIFSQSARMLEIIEIALGSIIDGRCIIRMDGRTTRSERTRLIEEFQKSVFSPPLVFLLTSKVGGVGVTLTKASRVIIFDPSQNPSDDNQSVDRAYRLGQKKDVLVYRLATCGTVEEHIYRRQVLKGEMACAVLEEEQCERQISKQERNVLSFPPRGFGYCETEVELAKLYGSKIERSLELDVELLKKHRFVIGITNHSLVFSIKDKLFGGTSGADGQDVIDNKRSQKGKGSKGCHKLLGTSQANDNMQAINIDVPKLIVRRLVADNLSEKKKMERASGAVICLPPRSAPQNDYQQLKLIGTPVEIAEAQNLINDLVKKERSKKRVEIYVPWEMVGLIIGKGGVTINKIKAVSGADIEKLPHPKKDHPNQAFQICGSEDEIDIARTMVVEILGKAFRR